MNKLLPVLCFVNVVAGVGCTSHSWTQIERTYIASDGEVFGRLPKKSKKCGMTLKRSNPESGVIVLSARRAVDQILTSSLFNMLLGDEVIVKAQHVGPTMTKVFIDSKAKGQIGPDLGRTDRNVLALAAVLDRVWPQARQEIEQRGEKRPGTKPAQLAPPETPDGSR